MVSDEVRRGITNARINEDNANIVFAELFFIVAAIGFYTQSWIWFGAAFVCSLIIVFIPILNMLLMLILSICWGVIGYSVGTLFSTSASVILAIIAFIIGCGIHFSALTYINDID